MIPGQLWRCLNSAQAPCLCCHLAWGGRGCLRDVLVGFSLQQLTMEPLATLLQFPALHSPPPPPHGMDDQPLLCLAPWLQWSLLLKLFSWPWGDLTLVLTPAPVPPLVGWSLPLGPSRNIRVVSISGCPGCPSLARDLYWSCVRACFSLSGLTHCSRRGKKNQSNKTHQDRNEQFSWCINCFSSPALCCPLRWTLGFSRRGLYFPHSAFTFTSYHRFYYIIFANKYYFNKWYPSGRYAGLLFLGGHKFWCRCFSRTIIQK